MKQWTEEDLILLYYNELDDEQTSLLTAAISASSELEEQFISLSGFLNQRVQIDVPAPSTDLNQRILKSIEVESKKITEQPEIENTFDRPASSSGLLKRVRNWFVVQPGGQFSAASFALLLIMVSVFFVGRWSAEPAIQIVAEVDTTEPDEQGLPLGERASRKILLSNVSSHMEAGQRLIRLVSNQDTGLGQELEQRGQIIEELIQFNRLYRRLAEQSEDTLLVSVLQQMESVLLEINHIEKVDESGSWKAIRRRIDETDLLYQLKVADKKINQEII